MCAVMNAIYRNFEDLLQYGLGNIFVEVVFIM